MPSGRKRVRGMSGGTRRSGRILKRKQQEEESKKEEVKIASKKVKPMYNARDSSNPCVHYPSKAPPTVHGENGNSDVRKRMPLPTRNKHGELVFKDQPQFRPNLTPKQVLQAGAFGGTYFRTIRSTVTNETHKGTDAVKEFPDDWFEGVERKRMLHSKVYDPSVNQYGVRCGGGLDMWETSGWISAQDPYGWFQWYCRFYLGRRTADDERQISRGVGVMGPKGRWRNNLIGKCARAGRPYDDYSVSPIVRQALLHWGYILTERDAKRYVKSKGLPELPKPLGTPAESRFKPSKKQPLYNPNNMQKLSASRQKILRAA